MRLLLAALLIGVQTASWGWAVISLCVFWWMDDHIKKECK